MGSYSTFMDPLDPVEDYSDGEAAEAPCTPVRNCAPCDEAEAWAPGAADPFDLQAFDEVQEELLKLGEDKAPSEASEAEEDDLEGALPEEEWERWSSKERFMWQRVRPESLRREAQQVLGLKMPDAVLTRLLRLHPQFQSKSSQALEIINLATVLLLQAVARATVRGKTEGAEDGPSWGKFLASTPTRLHGPPIAPMPLTQLTGGPPGLVPETAARPSPVQQMIPPQVMYVSAQPRAASPRAWAQAQPKRRRCARRARRAGGCDATGGADAKAGRFAQTATGMPRPVPGASNGLRGVEHKFLSPFLTRRCRSGGIDAQERFRDRQKKLLFWPDFTSCGEEISIKFPQKSSDFQQISLRGPIFQL
eukprot:s1461_g9.t1